MEPPAKAAVGTTTVAMTPSAEDALKQSETEPENDSHDLYNDMMSSHQSLNRFMEDLLEDAAVLPVHTLLVQDNASILTENASRSAHANNKKFSLGHDYLITKEISRWESYPFEVDTPIVVSKPKKIKNGCAPQRRAKRTGRETPGEIKASIKKQAESLPKAPRRRSSAATDNVKKSVVQEELLTLFDSNMDDSNASNEGSRRAASPVRSAWPKRPESNNHNPKAGRTPKMPVRRVSELPEDLSDIYQPSSLASLSASRPTTIHDHLAMNSGGSQHSSTSTESTLSEIAPRTSDAADVPAPQQSFKPLLESTSLECSMIEEEDDVRDHNGPILPSSITNDTAAPISGRFPKKPPPTSTPKKPVRRVSEIPEDLGDVGSSSLHSTTSTSSSVIIDKTVPSSQLTSADSDSAPPLVDAVSKSKSIDDSEDDGSIPAGILPPAITYDNKNGDGDDLMAIKRSSLPKKPVRRVSEIPEDLAYVEKS